MPKAAMLKDHYVSQVHLKHFYAASLGGKKMHAFRKSDGKQFFCGSEDVCHVVDGSTNPYMQEARAIEDFLRFIEPNYNTALRNLRECRQTAEDCFVMAGFAAYVMCCSPAGMRLQSEPLKASLEATAALLDRRGEIGPSPAELGGRSITELLRSGAVKIDIDPKYPQAIGISVIIDIAIAWCNSAWMVLHKAEDANPFFTSDFPVALEKTGDLRVDNRIVPLAPDLAIRILPDLAYVDLRDTSFKGLRVKHLEAGSDVVSHINDLIVRCAEDQVFSSINEEWVKDFVAERAAMRVELVTSKIPTPDGFLNVTTSMIRSRVPTA